MDKMRINSPRNPRMLEALLNSLVVVDLGSLVLRRVERRVLLDEQAFFQWVESNNNKGVKK